MLSAKRLMLITALSICLFCGQGAESEGRPLSSVFPFPPHAAMQVEAPPPISLSGHAPLLIEAFFPGREELNVAMAADGKEAGGRIGEDAPPLRQNTVSSRLVWAIWIILAVSLVLAFLAAILLYFNQRLQVEINDRKNMQEALTFRNAFEALIRDISSRFINVSSQAVHEEIRSALQKICTFTGSDGGYVFRFFPRESIFRLVHYWANDRLEANVDHLAVIPAARIPWLMKRLAEQEITSFADIDDMPEAADWEKLMAQSQGIGSIIGIPMIYQGEIEGILGICSSTRNRSWSGDEINLLQMAGQIFINALRRQQYEETLQKYEHIVAASNDLMALLDPNYVYQAVNAVYCQVYGRKRTEIIGHSVAELVGEACFAKKVKPNLDRCLAGDVARYSSWFNFPRAGKRYVEAVYYPYRGEGGKITGIVANIRDITEQKTLEEQLLQSQKMEAIGTLAGGIAHDFNNLLMGIQGRVSIMAMKLNASDPITEHLKGIEDHVQSAADLTRQLLGFARGGKYKVEPTDMNELIRKQTRMFGRTRKEIVFHEELALDLWPVEVDQGQLKQVLLNLYLNAWQAMPQGGDIMVGTGNRRLEEKTAAARGVSPGRFIQVTVGDTGVGMDTKTRQRIFEPFFTTKAMGRGSGLGLASSYGIIKNHGGYIDVASTPGKGTTFSIYLPASAKAPAQPGKPQTRIHQGQGTILLIDDEPMILQIGQQLLESLGYDVLKAASGAEGLEIYAAAADRIKLVILDMVMPGLNGKDTFAALKEMDPEVRVLLASGYCLEGETERMLDLGLCGFIQKPFSLERLSEKIRATLYQEAFH